MVSKPIVIMDKVYILRYKDNKPPFKWQIDCFKKLVPLDYGAIFAEVGTGKSAALIYLLQAHFLSGEIDSVLLLAPNSVYRQWDSQQFPEHLAVPYETYLWGTYSVAKDKKQIEEFTRRKTDKLKILIVNIEAFSYDKHLDVFKAFLTNNKCAYVVDESTRIKTPDAKRTINIVAKMNKALMFRGQINSVTHAAVKRYIMTGTPVDGSPLSVYSPFNFLDWGFFKCTYSVFRQRHALLSKEKTSTNKIYFRNVDHKRMKQIRKAYDEGTHPSVLSKIFNITETDIEYIVSNRDSDLPWKNLDRLKNDIATCSYTITLDEAFPNAPQEVVLALDVDLSAEQKKVYKELQKFMYTNIQGKELTVTTKLTLAMRLQQVTGGFITLTKEGDDEGQVEGIPGTNSKYNALKEDIEDVVKRPIIIFCRFVAEAKYIAERLQKDFDEDVGLIISGVGQKDREDILRRFDAGDISFLVATPGCLSTGRNLQKANIIYFYSLSFSSEEHVQAKGRIRRATQKEKNCIYKYIIAKGTVDEHVYASLVAKMDLHQYFQLKEITDKELLV